MKIAFIDIIDWDYTPEAPLKRPFGGAQSALCYLSAALAARGHQVSLINHATQPGDVLGVCVTGWEGGWRKEAVDAHDVVICLNSAVGKRIRAELNPSVPVMLWTQHAHDQPDVEALSDPAERDAWDRVVCLSQWHRDSFAQAFGLPAGKLAIQRNAIAPVFERVEPAKPWYRANRSPVLAYTSTPFRGLEVLLTAFPTIRAAVPGVRLEIYSSMGVYQLAGDKDPYRVLYTLARELQGVKYVGSVPQPKLAQALSACSVLAYPNIFPETSCISVMEAQAAGCLVVTSTLGALPETTAGFGILVQRKSGSLVRFAASFADVTIDLLRKAKADPGRADSILAAQLAHVRGACTWAARAREWEEWLEATVNWEPRSNSCAIRPD